MVWTAYRFIFLPPCILFNFYPPCCYAFNLLKRWIFRIFLRGKKGALISCNLNVGKNKNDLSFFFLFFFSSRRFRWWKFFSPLFLFSSVVECKYSRSWKLFVYIITQGNPFNSANFNKSVIVCSNLFVSKWNLNFQWKDTKSKKIKIWTHFKVNNFIFSKLLKYCKTWCLIRYKDKYLKRNIYMQIN